MSYVAYGWLSSPAAYNGYMGKVEKLTKLEAARREINAAIRMFFSGEDPIAIHAVVAGGMQIVSDLGAKKGLKLGIESLVDGLRPEYRNKYRKLMRDPQNDIKHADKNGDENKIIVYRTEALEGYLYFAAVGYQEYAGISTPETRVFIGWFSMCNPQILDESDYKTNIEQLVKKKGNLTEDKLQFLEWIKKVRAEKPIEGIDYR